MGAWQIHVRQVHRRFSLILGERTRVAREIHDTLLQSLVGVAFQFDAASSEYDESPPIAKARLERLRTQIELAIKEARRSIWDLRSPALQQRELPAAIREVGEMITGRAVRFDLAVRGALPKTCRGWMKRCAHRREAISNAVRHGSATEVLFNLIRPGRGHSPRDRQRQQLRMAPAQVVDHWGLATMRGARGADGGGSGW